MAGGGGDSSKDDNGNNNNNNGENAAAGTTATTSSSGASASMGLMSKTSDIIDVTIHPLVLLSAADHYHRVARGTRKRVVGILLGTYYRGHVDATNSFAVPFEEDNRNPTSVFYLDHNFLENMLAMFRKVSAKERVVGFYSTGPQIRPNDLRIHDIVSRYCGIGGANNKDNAANTTTTSISAPPAVFCIIDVRPDRPDLPITAYKVVEETEVSTSSSKQGSQAKVQRSLAHVPSKMGALEAEEVGVEHLLRDINDPTISTTASLIQGKLAGLATLTEKLVECKDYLTSVATASDPTPGGGTTTRRLVANPEIIANLQTVLSLLPNLNTPNLIKSMLVKCNDMHMAIYLASLIRTVMALHDLVNNKIRYGQEQGGGGSLLGGNGEDDDDENDDDEEKKQDDDKKTTSKDDNKTSAGSSSSSSSSKK